jgi:hypothetical protein
MPRSSSLPSLVASLAVIAALACQTVDHEDAADEVGDGDGDPTGPTGDGDPTDPTGSGDGGPIANCSPGVATSCPAGQKCTALILAGSLIYDCVSDDIDKQPYEPCVPAPSTGEDGCPAGYVCVPYVTDGAMGHCLELCSSDGQCDAALCTAPPSSKIPVCAGICDPLAPFCPALQSCQRVRQTAFVCQYPHEDDNGTTAAPCNSALDRGCAEGFVCETGGVIPDCNEASCCTALCDLDDIDPCTPPMSCNHLPLDPQPGLENVGACYVPQ